MCQILSNTDYILAPLNELEKNCLQKTWKLIETNLHVRNVRPELIEVAVIDPKFAVSSVFTWLISNQH